MCVCVCVCEREREMNNTTTEPNQTYEEVFSKNDKMCYIKKISLINFVWYIQKKFNYFYIEKSVVSKNNTTLVHTED